ncbi:hypothetical protein D3C81_2059400 [compost metagenome]
MDRLAVQEYTALAGLQYPGHGLQDSRLSRAVGSYQGSDLAGGNGEIQILHDQAAFIGDIQLLGKQTILHIMRPLSSWDVDKTTRMPLAINAGITET